MKAVDANGLAVLSVGSFELELTRVPLDEGRTVPGSWSTLGQGEGE